MSSHRSLTELDSAGRTLNTYILSSSQQQSKKREAKPSEFDRVDVIRPEIKGSKLLHLWQQVLAIFLPVGYPNSVTEDYIDYQIYDSLQAFSSSIAGLLASRAVLEGVGVGDATATPTAAILLSILQDSTGRIATILFAHRVGTALEPECKSWRLAADIFNDAAMILDCLSPALPRVQRTVLLSVSSSLRALCGVAAGSAKASLSNHFAKWGNLGELNAKDGAQETVISLLGMLAGSLVVNYITTPVSTWSALLFLIFIHLYTNHSAVRSVRLRTLNRQRASLVLSHALTPGNTILSPKQASEREYIFPCPTNALRWQGGDVMVTAVIGNDALSRILNSLSLQHNRYNDSKELYEPSISDILSIFKEEQYILWYPRRTQILIALKEGITPVQQLKAWAHALLLAKAWLEWVLSFPERLGNGDSLHAEAELMEIIASTLEQVNRDWKVIEEGLRRNGWDVDTASLETGEGTRVKVDI